MTPEGLAALCAAALPAESLSVDEITTCCFGPDTETIGDERGVAVLTAKSFGTHVTAGILLLAVRPDHQGRGVGRALVEEAAARARTLGAGDLHLGNVPPRYVWPGVDYSFTQALALFEATGFERDGAECNMTIDTGFQAEPPNGVSIVRAPNGDIAAELARAQSPHWEDEMRRAAVQGTCFVARDDTGATVGFACHSVNRRHWIGPMATSATRRHGGVGSALLSAVCADVAAAGPAATDIAWVGPLGFYTRAGARVSRVFRTACRSL